MRYTVEQITEEQAQALLPLDEVKVWAKVQYALEDDLLKRVRKAVILKAEKFTGKLFVRRQVQAYPLGDDYSACGLVRLPYATNVDNVTVIRADKGQEPVLQIEDNGYTLFGYPNGTVKFPYPGYRTDSIHLVLYTTGYDVSTGDLDDLIVACEQMITGFFQHRKEFETGTIVITIPSQAQSILRSYISNPLFV